MATGLPLEAVDEADVSGLALVDRFLTAAKADASEGENSEAIEALGT